MGSLFGGQGSERLTNHAGYFVWPVGHIVQAFARHKRFPNAFLVLQALVLS